MTITTETCIRALVIDGRRVPLSHEQSHIMTLLLAAHGAPVADAALVPVATPGAAPAAMQRLRRELGSAATCLVAVRGVGYAWRQP